MAVASPGAISVNRSGQRINFRQPKYFKMKALIFYALQNS